MAQFSAVCFQVKAEALEDIQMDVEIKESGFNNSITEIEESHKDELDLLKVTHKMVKFHKFLQFVILFLGPLRRNKGRQGQTGISA